MIDTEDVNSNKTIQDSARTSEERRQETKTRTHAQVSIRSEIILKNIYISPISPLFGLNLNLSFSNLISSGVNFFDNLRKKTPTTPQSSATESSSPR